MTKPADDDLIERLDAGEPARSPEEAEARRPYEQLFADLRDLEDIAPPPGWEDRAVANLAAAKRKQRVRTALTASAAGAAVTAIVAALVLMPCGGPAGPGLSVAVMATSGAARRGDSAVGDVLHVQARIARPQVDLRLYLNTRLVTRCPGGEGCRSDSTHVALDWKLAEPGTYRVVLLSSDAEIPSGDGTIDRDLLDARNAAATNATETILVHP